MRPATKPVAITLSASGKDPLSIHYPSKERKSIDTTTMNKGLGWFSLALGAAELFAPAKIASLAGAPGSAALSRAFAARELAAGAGLFHSPTSTEPGGGLVVGDALYLSTPDAL